MSAAKPMDPIGRLNAYLGGYGQPPKRASLTPRQRRRITHKANRAAGTREMTPRQVEAASA